VILTFTVLLILHQESLYLIVAFDEGASGPVAREWFTGRPWQCSVNFYLWPR